MELEHKRALVERALRARGISIEVPLPSPSPRREGARARVALQVLPDGSLVNHAPGSHEAVEPPLDAMARPEIATAARALTARLGGLARLSSSLERVELRSDGARVVAVFSLRPGARLDRSLGPAVVEALGPNGAVSVGTRPLAGKPSLELAVGGQVLAVGPLSFFQVNLEVNAALVGRVTSLVAAQAPTTVLDLFGGAGNLAFPIAASGVPVELIESSPHAVRDARHNAERTGLDVRVSREDAYGLQPGSRFFDVAVLDPPRRGAGPAMASVCATRPRALVLISCHPPALARDIQQAQGCGYRLDLLELYDMFPLTSHVESLALLLR